MRQPILFPFSDCYRCWLFPSRDINNPSATPRDPYGPCRHRKVASLCRNERIGRRALFNRKGSGNIGLHALVAAGMLVYLEGPGNDVHDLAGLIDLFSRCWPRARARIRNLVLRRGISLFRGLSIPAIGHAAG